jgi:hypothetical protein
MVEVAVQAHRVVCAVSPHHFDFGDYKLRPLMVYQSENLWAFICFPFYAFLVYVVICRNAYGESHL